MTTPLIPEITVTETPGSLGVCNCCGVENTNRDVKHVKFMWRMRGAKQGGGTAVALCRVCRRTAAAQLVESL